MAYQKNKAPRYAKGFSEAAVYDVVTGDLLYWTNKLQTGSTSTSMNDGAIEGGLGNKLLANIPDTIRLTGTFEAADFSLEARGLQMGSSVQYNAKSMIREKIVAQSTTLTVTRTPVAAYGQANDSETYYCYVGNDGVNYGVNPTTKEIQGFTAEVGKEYCVQYYTDILNAERLAIPTNFSPTIGYMVIKTPMYSENGTSAKNSSLAGYLYGFYPRVQFIGGDAGVNGSQTDATTTSLNFTALAYDELSDEVCTDCGSEDSVYGYLTYVPCGGDELSAVKGLAIVGGIIGLSADANAANHTAQIPVFYYMDNGQLITPTYTDLTYTSDNEAVTVSSSGLLTGASAIEDAHVTASIKKNTGTTNEKTLSATVSVMVAAATA